MRRNSYRDIFDQFKDLNRRVAQGEDTLYREVASKLFPYPPQKDDRLLHYPRIGVYAGEGTSHSWLWFLDVFDRMGFYDVDILSEKNIQENGLLDLDVLAMSGGDTFAMAEGLGYAGSKNIEAFVRKGGLYIGSCAGAYLPLHSSKEHLNRFNFVTAKISNLTKILPKAKAFPDKFFTPYGGSFVFHPVRGEVNLRFKGVPPFQDSQTLIAPLYGGPSMIPSGSVDTLAYYEGFTDKTVFLVDNDIAAELLVKKAAAIRSKMDAGHFYLFGPHFEHPHFPKANMMLGAAIYWDGQNDTGRRTVRDDGIMSFNGSDMKEFIRSLKREVSNSRIVAYGMEWMPIGWVIGRKIYDFSKIRVFIEAMFGKILLLQRLDELKIKKDEMSTLLTCGQGLANLLRKLRMDAKRGNGTSELARDIFKTLKEMSSAFFKVYFRTMSYIFQD